MSQRIVYYGNFNSSKSNELKDYAFKKLKSNSGSKLHYILPNGDLLKKYRYEFIDNAINIFDLNVSTFDDVVLNILKYDFNKMIEKPMKNFILKNIIKDQVNANLIVYYKEVAQLDGFIEYIGDRIGEIKRSLIYPDVFIKESKDKIEFLEIGYIYKAYEEYLHENKLLDREGQYFRAIELLRDSNNDILNAETVIIDYFYDFRPIELEIIKELSKRDSDILINIPFYTKNRNRILSKTLNDLEKIGFIIEKNYKESITRFEELGENFFTGQKLEIEENKIQINRAPNVYLELDSVFLEIKKLQKRENHLSDIAIVLTDESYKESIFAVAKENNIALDSMEKQYLYEQPIVIEMLNILKNIKSNGYKYDLINRLNSHYFRIMDEETLSMKNLYELELILRNLDCYRIEGENLVEKQKYFNSMYNDLNSKLIGNDEDRYRELLFKFIELMDSELSRLDQYNTIYNYNHLILELIEEYKVYEKIMNNYRSIDNKDLFLRDIRTLNELERIFESMEGTYDSNFKINLEEYIFILEQYIMDSQVLVTNSSKSGVKILNPITCRGQDYKYLFIVGLNQGSYPSTESRNLFNEKENIDYLKNMNFFINSYHENLDKQTMNFLSAIARVDGKLFLSYCAGKDGSKIESMYVSEIKRLISNNENILINNIKLSNQYKFSQNNVKNEQELLLYTIDQIKNEKYLDLNLKNGNNIYFDLEKIIDINKCDYYRNNDVFNNYQGRLNDKDNIDEITEFNNRVYSITYLEEYARCPYSFLLSRILKVEETKRELETYDHMEIGNIYHDILMSFYESYNTKIKDDLNKGIDFDNEILDMYILERLKSIFIKNNIDLSKKSNYIIFKGIQNNLMRYLEYDLNEIYRFKYVPENLEYEFNNFMIEDTIEKIELMGKIDRVDKSIYSNSYSVIDYKTSSYGLRKLKDIKEGVSFQLPVYILSQEEKDVVQGGYGIIKDFNNEYTMVQQDKSPFVKRNNSLSYEEWEELLNDTKKNIFEIKRKIDSGDFSVKPKECSSYCIYKDICRYKNIRR